MPPSTVTLSATSISKQLRFLDQRIEILSKYAAQLETALFSEPIGEIKVGSDAYFKFTKLYIELLKVTQDAGATEQKAVELLMKVSPKPTVSNREADEMYAMLKSMKPDELGMLKQAYLLLSAPAAQSNAASITKQARQLLEGPPPPFAIRRGSIDLPEGQVVHKGRKGSPSVVKDSEGVTRLVFPDDPGPVKEPPTAPFADTLLADPDDELLDGLSAFFLEAAPE
jgi:hypothetical protein